MRLKTITLLLMLLPALALAQDSGDESMEGGLRGGFSRRDSKDEDFQQYEIFLNRRLPWSWHWSGGWQLDSWLDGSAGVLNGGGQSGFVGSLGISLVAGVERLPLFLDVGISPTVLSRSTFGEADFGGNFQFTSHLGLRLRLGRQFELTYRVQHMSNGDLATPNPGSDMNMFSLAYRFSLP
jgi:hypothetical protein